MGAEPESHEGAAEWTHDPANPVPHLIEDPWRPLLGLPDERPAHMRPDVLTFTGEEQRTPLDLAGPIEVTVVVQADAPSTHVVARLCDVYPDGRTHLIVEGVAHTGWWCQTAAELLWPECECKPGWPGGHRPLPDAGCARCGV